MATLLLVAPQVRQIIWCKKIISRLYERSEWTWTYNTTQNYCYIRRIFLVVIGCGLVVIGCGFTVDWMQHDLKAHSTGMLGYHSQH